jgi:transcriptional regulator with GAF, ATPase, and Fis domain
VRDLPPPESSDPSAASSFERLLAELSTRFINLPAESVKGEILSALARIGEFLELDRAIVTEFTAGGAALVVKHSWAAPGVEAIRPGAIMQNHLPRVFEEIRAGQVARIADCRLLANDPLRAKEWQLDLREFERSGARAHLSIPVSVGGEPVGAFTVVRIRGPHPWPDPLVKQLGLLAQVVGNAIHRSETERLLRSALARVEELGGRLEGENLYLRAEVEAGYDSVGIIGHDQAIEHAMLVVDQVAPTDARVLILGETGTGKELFARAVHARSKRSDRPLIRVNCAALPASLAESELFGHEKGAFTGAIRRRIGRLELAHRGTLFLDEVADLSLELQAKLLRVLQEGEFERLGSSETRSTDVRVIAATSRDLAAAVESGDFRADLFYRLRVVPIEIPPLRDRREDIPALVWNFVELARARHAGPSLEIAATTMERLVAYAWPGNVRELENVVERAVILSPGPELVLGDLRIDARARPPSQSAAASVDDIAATERSHILRVLEDCGWKVKGAGHAAERLGLHPSTLRGRMRKLGIERPTLPGKR